jgi:hypothetical protein
VTTDQLNILLSGYRFDATPINPPLDTILSQLHPSTILSPISRRYPFRKMNNYPKPFLSELDIIVVQKVFP